MLGLDIGGEILDLRFIVYSVCISGVTSRVKSLVFSVWRIRGLAVTFVVGYYSLGS